MSDPLRIAVYHNLPSGGAKRVVYEQVAGLAARGHTVDVFVPGTAEERFRPLREVARGVHVFPHPEPPDRERMLAGLPAPLDAPRWLAFLASMRRLERRIAGAIDCGGYDVVLVHPSRFTQAPWVLGALATPAVYYCHEPLRAAREPRIARLPVRLALRLTLARTDRAQARAAAVIASNSRFTAGAVRAVYGRTARVAYPGVDAARFTPGAGPAGDYVLTVGALHPLKGIDFLIGALGRLAPADRPPLRVVSDRARAAERLRIERLAGRAGVALQLILGASEDDLVSHYRGARVVLYAPHREPLGLVPLEAMACGRPVLAVREGGIPETVVDGRTGFLEPRDEARFAARLRALLAAPAGADAVGRAAAGAVRAEWDWPHSIRVLEGVLAEALGGRAEAPPAAAVPSVGRAS